MLSSLLVELYDETIRYLWDDKTALAACSLTSRALTNPSQKALSFQGVLTSPADCYTGDQYIPPGGTSTSFWNNVLKKSLRIAGYVRCLQVIHYQNENWVCHDTFLPKILPLHKHLKAFVVFGVPDWSNLSADIQHAFQDVVRLPSLVHLDISCCAAVRFSQHFSNNLKHLVLHRSCYHDVLGPFEARAPIYLESLYLVHAQRSFFSLIMNPNCPFKCNYLRKLETFMDTGQFVECRQLSLVLLSCRETLEELQLTLRISFDAAAPPQSPPFDLSLMSSLKTVTLAFNASHRHVNWGPASCLKFLLCSVSSPYQRLEEIMVVIEFYNSRHDETDHDIHWVSDFFLDENRCPRLRKLSIYAMINGSKDHKSRFITSVDDSESTKNLRARPGMDFIATTGKLAVDRWRFLLDERWVNVTCNEYSYF